MMLVAFTTLVASTMTVTKVCVTGYIMDIFCIERGSLLDNNNVVTLEGPQLHSVHCLVDPGVCRNSGFEVLDRAVGATGSHCRAFRLDASGNAAALAAARAYGDPASCSTCTGTKAPLVQKGFRATVVGDAQGTSAPYALSNVKVLHHSVSCNASLPCDLRCYGGCTTGTGTGSGSGSGGSRTGTGTGTGGSGAISGGGGSAASTATGANPAAQGLSRLEGLQVSHGTLMLCGWGLLLPLGVASAKLGKHRGPLWFKAHRTLQVTGLALALGGFIIAVSTFNVFEADYPAANKAHGILGLIVMSLGLAQPLNAFVRPHKVQGEAPSPARRAWEWLHKGSGWVAVVLAVPTIAIGTTLVKPSQSAAFQAGYGAAWAVVVLVVLALLRDRQQRAPANGQPEISFPEPSKGLHG